MEGRVDTKVEVEGGLGGLEQGSGGEECCAGYDGVP